MDFQPVNAAPPAPQRDSSSSARISASLRDSLLNSLHLSQDPRDSNSSFKLNNDSNRSSFPMIPSLRNSLRSSIHSSFKKKNSITKDINSIMEIYDLISVKDFGYPVSNSLHYGLSNYELYLNNQSSLDNFYGTDFDNYNINNNQEELVDEEEPVQKAIVLFDFQPENDNELEIKENQIINILYRHGQGWLVGQDLEDKSTGLIPEEYVELIFEEDGQIFTAEQLLAGELDDEADQESNEKSLGSNQEKVRNDEAL